MNRRSRIGAALAAGILGFAAAGADAQCFNWSLVQTPNAPPPREFAGMGYDPDLQRTIVVGGYDNAQRTDVWAWNGTAWSPLPSLPAGQSDSSVVYDTVRHRLISFGGQPAGFYNSNFYEFDGAAWQVQQVPFPGPSASAKATWDSARQEMIVFSSSGTWSYSAQGWTLRTSVGPTFRINAALAYDSYRQRVVMFGGGNSAPFMNDLWEWDGLSWTQVNIPNGPSPRRYARLAFDAGRGRMILFGGFNTTGFLADTWEYNGSSWTLLANGTPAPREAPSVAYDASVGKILIFGGFQGGTTPYLSELYRSETTIPAIVEQPQSVQALEGGFAAFHIRPFHNAGPVFFTWYKNGVPISGATTAFLTFPSVTQADAGQYTCSVGGQCAAAYSVAATLTVKCYANCDGSTNSPALNVNDFVCFLNRFGNGCPD